MNENIPGQTATSAAAPQARAGFDWRALLPDAAAVVFFLLLSLAYFITPVSQGLVLNGHDSVASVGLGQEQMEHVERTGEVGRWTNAVFSGMPTYQITPSYGPSSTLSTLERVYALGTSGAVSYVFLYLIGFYILLRAFRCRPLLSAFGAVVWAFSSYFFIIIAAGHIWKVMTLAFIPPTVAGVVLCYRGRYWAGAVVTALFTALQVWANHLQMTYYFLFLMGFVVVAYGVDALVRRKGAAFLRATSTLLVAGVLGVLVNLPNLYHTYAYSKESMRGRAELSPLPSERGAAGAATEGLDRDYITQWSYGLDETLTLMIPDFKGGGSGSVFDVEGVESLPGYDRFYRGAGAVQQVLQESGVQMVPPGFNRYWGDQPFTVGPVYAGAIVCLLFWLGVFYVRGPLKWALLAASVLALLFSWGRNLMPVTDFFIDHLPLYSKFRTVSSALVVVEFCLPLLGILGLARILREPQCLRERPVGACVALVLTGGVCLLLWMFPGLAGDCLSAEESQAMHALYGVLPPDVASGYSSGITALRHSILRADALRSLLFIAAGAALIVLYVRGRLRAWVVCASLAVLSLVDMWSVNKRYLNDDSFSDPVQQLAGFDKTAADEEILRDKSLSYRVLNLSAGNPFNETSNQTSYWHKSIGGYHAAKLHRYQDLIDRRLMREIQAYSQAVGEAGGVMDSVAGDRLFPTLNMLNMKYTILGTGSQTLALANPYANGNGWFVSALSFVKGADAEMAALDSLDTKHAAVADERFRPQLEGPLGEGTVSLTSYEMDELSYDVSSPQGGLVVFSEIFYPGWTVTIDGRPAEFGRVNYVLRALRVPAGTHKVVATFRPASVTLTERLGYAALAVILLGLVALVVVRRRGGRKTAASASADDGE